MIWGRLFLLAWKAAPDIRKAAAAEIATDVTWLGQKTVGAGRWTRDKAIDAGRWTRDRAVDAATWTKNTAIRAANWTADQVIAAEHLAARSVARVTADAAGKTIVKARAAERWVSEKVAAGWRGLRSLVSDQPPDNPRQSCTLPKSDVDYDGTLMAYPDGQNGKCLPVTAKGQDISRQDVEDAKSNGYESQSTCCQRMRAAGMKPRTIVYVNGVLTDKDTHCKTLKAIGDATCAKVVGVYNATEGVGDYVEASQDRALINETAKGHKPRTRDGRNPAVETMQDVITAECLAGQPIEIWAHSQGGAIASLALYGAGNDLALEGHPGALTGVSVTSFASAAPHWPDGPDYEHYVHVNDLIPVTLGLGDDSGADAKRAGKNANVIRFSGKPPDFETDPPRREAIAVTGNHGVKDVYLQMYKKEHGGCP